MKWRNKGLLIIPNVLDKGDIIKTDALWKAENLEKTF